VSSTNFCTAFAVKYDALITTTQIFSPNSVCSASRNRIVVSLLQFSAHGREKRLTAVAACSEQLDVIPRARHRQ
jgi:hypothetical protein